MLWAYFSEEQGKAIVEMLKTGSERIIALISGTLLDEALRRTLEERLRKSDISDKLFKVGGPLGNLGPKIDLAYQLYAIDKPVRNAGYGISEIRNFFAHNLDASFDSTDEKIVTALSKLALHEGRTYYPFHQAERDSEIKIPPVKSNVDKFVFNLQIALLLLMRDRSRHVLHSNYHLSSWAPTAPQEQPKPSPGKPAPPNTPRQRSRSRNRKGRKPQPPT